MKLILCEYKTQTPNMFNVDFDGETFSARELIETYPGVGPELFDDRLIQFTVSDAIAGRFGETAIDIDGEKCVAYKMSEPKNFLRETYTRKIGLLQWRQEGQRIEIVVLVPFVGCTSDDITMYMNVPAGCERRVSGIDYEESPLTPSVLFKEHMPKIAMTELSRSGGVVEIGLDFVRHTGEHINADQDVYLEATAGSLNINRVKLVDGRAVVLLDISSVPANTWLKVKTGYKWFSGVAELEMIA